MNLRPVLALLTCLLLSESQASKIYHSPYSTSRAIGALLVAVPIIGLGTTIAHETGHSLTNTILRKKPFHIGIGGYPSDKSLLETKYVTLKGLNPFSGYVEIGELSQKEKPLHHITIGSAGAIFGFLFNCLIHKMTKKRLKGDLLSIIHEANHICGFANLTNLIPFPGSDGYKVLENIKKLSQKSE